jgi:hypothetical protein
MSQFFFGVWTKTERPPKLVNFESRLVIDQTYPKVHTTNPQMWWRMSVMVCIGRSICVCVVLFASKDFHKRPNFLRRKCQSRREKRRSQEWELPAACCWDTCGFLPCTTNLFCMFLHKSLTFLHVSGVFEFRQCSERHAIKCVDAMCWWPTARRQCQPGWFRSCTRSALGPAMQNLQDSRCFFPLSKGIFHCLVRLPQGRQVIFFRRVPDFEIFWSFLIHAVQNLSDAKTVWRSQLIWVCVHWAVAFSHEPSSTPRWWFPTCFSTGIREAKRIYIEMSAGDLRTRRRRNLYRLDLFLLDVTASTSSFLENASNIFKDCKHWCIWPNLLLKVGWDMCFLLLVMYSRLFPQYSHYIPIIFPILLVIWAIKYASICDYI